MKSSVETICQNSLVRVLTSFILAENLSELHQSANSLFQLGRLYFEPRGDTDWILAVMERLCGKDFEAVLKSNVSIFFLELKS